jgi:para-aminobenzoate synthetase/4-amino-4-deoxychorismate lyase
LIADAREGPEWPALSASDCFALLDDSRHDDAANTTCLYHGNARLIEARAPADVEPSWQRIQTELSAGRFVVGLFHFELGYELEARLRTARSDTEPLLQALSFTDRRRLTPAQTSAWLERMSTGEPDVAIVRKPRLNMTREAYRAAIARVLDYIRAGDTYQVNYTLKYRFDYDGHPLRIYQQLRARQRVEYGALIRLPQQWVLSLSPELFFKREGEQVIAKPMKGTSKRGVNPQEDMMRGAWLKEDEKNLAENVMIVDLIRNDLGRLARVSSVKVDPLFEVEAYQTLLQMTSTVRAQVPRAVSTLRLLRELFPCGSITGAPKIRTMQIIRELEAEPRGLYTGAIGVIEPSGDACFNVAIRTAVLSAHEERGGSGEMGVGSGVVADSVADDEFDECRLKGRFLTELGTDFELIETLRWSRAEGFPLLEAHLRRLAHSGEYFGFACDTGRVRATLHEHAARFADDRPRRVRLTLARDGELRVRADPWIESLGLKRVVISPQRIDARDPLYGHKTTRRALYDGEFARVLREYEAYEVIFFNQCSELAEGSRSNVFLELDGRLCTPPLASGCLPGVMRAQILAQRADACERVLHEEDLARATRVFVCNAVRGLVQVSLA